jgi:hypothetical protein
MDASDLTPVPSKGFGTGREKLAFMSGHFRLAGVLPAGPLPGMVRWANGTTLRLPLLSARAAFAELAAERPCAVPNACGQLTVTGAEPGVVTVRTSRGPASVPAWRFTVAGLGRYHRHERPHLTHGGVEGLEGLAGRVEVGIFPQGLADAVTVEFLPHRAEDGAKR